MVRNRAGKEDKGTCWVLADKCPLQEKSKQTSLIASFFTEMSWRRGNKPYSIIWYLWNGCSRSRNPGKQAQKQQQDKHISGSQTFCGWSRRSVGEPNGKKSERHREEGKGLGLQGLVGDFKTLGFRNIQRLEALGSRKCDILPNLL